MRETVLYVLLGINIATFFLLVILARQVNKREEAQNAFNILEKYSARIEMTFKDEIRRNREEMTVYSRALREEVHNTLSKVNESVLRRLSDNLQTQMMQLETFSAQLRVLTQSNEDRLENMRNTVEKKLSELRQDNTQKLEEMRKTVDEKLNATLERRLGESFRLVSERLELVHKGLGEMQILATGVGDLKRVLTNVKTRGIWGEIHLGNLLEQILTMEQYEKNVATKPGSNERVEFAIKLPGRDKEGTTVWLPIDAKFPQEDYQRLLDAQDEANLPLVEEAGKALENRIKGEAKEIAEKYISVPHTTEFAILFLPIEGLYAEVLRRPGLCDQLMQRYKVIITGPTTLAALLNSLQMGFRTLAIEKRSSEVWAMLGAVKTEFGKFGDLLEKTQKKLQEASNSIDTAARKSRTIERKLKTVQELPAEEAVGLLNQEYEEKIEVEKQNI
ncbi:DNA recombination protein RmuC homolog [Propionispora sp. 2/2-37]|uniref:DNA recombination protein RmuC n=1 Tax=Propionispora sp. 2/2-37 TaxID=1677858 RepID=UPI0006BB7D7F|nr:DNA recombination protein RmuC [Propionispora sp. 2/2-37]CUH95456.1 DNA recombination protein RmuC homolog [Propionispora sp. 2/2-37]